MIEQKQLFRHFPDQRIIGDCFRTCVACLLDLPPVEVPHVFQEVFNFDDYDAIVTDEAHRLLNDWLRPRNLAFVEFPLEGTYDQMRAYITYYMAGRHVMVGCNSKNGGHSVVMRGMDYMWDPSIDNSGCVGPMKDGYWWIGLLIART